jgi:homoserine dehydrogenase
MIKTYKLALLGFGNVNRALAQIIADDGADMAKRLGFELSIVAVSDLFLGSAYDGDGLDLRALTALPAEKGALSAIVGGRSGSNNEVLIKDTVADIVAEATPTDSKTGEPARTHCRWALEAGKHVVTSNKGPAALHSEELRAVALENRVQFGIEGTVMSGTPVLRMAKRQLKGCHISGFKGVLNGTANYILDRMEDGAPLDIAIAEAQSYGYAEADPTADIEGWDVLLKVVILSEMVLGVQISPHQVRREGITGLSPEDVANAPATGHRWKLIGEATLDDNGTVSANVSPQRLANTHPLAGISGATNAITFETNYLGQVTVSGPGAGRMETGFALLSDIIAIHQKLS